MDFDLDEFLKEMDEYECNEDKESENFDESFNQLCEDNLEKSALKDIGEFREDGLGFWNFLQNKVYLPLAFDIPRVSSVSEMLK